MWFFIPIQNLLIKKLGVRVRVVSNQKKKPLRSTLNIFLLPPPPPPLLLLLLLASHKNENDNNKRRILWSILYDMICTYKQNQKSHTIRDARFICSTKHACIHHVFRPSAYDTIKMHGNTSNKTSRHKHGTTRRSGQTYQSYVQRAPDSTPGKGCRVTTNCPTQDGMSLKRPHIRSGVAHARTRWTNITKGVCVCGPCQELPNPHTHTHSHTHYGEPGTAICLTVYFSCAATLH